MRGEGRGEGSSAPLTIADMGCGKGYLTFGAWHLFRRVWRRPVRVIGVEARPDLVQFNCRVARQIGAQELEFVEGTICSVPLSHLDALIALHACDTATDSAIIRGVGLGAKLIVVAPCCHRELRPKLRHTGALAPVLRHGLMEERLAEWLTDALRALYLEWAGYRTKVMEFVSAGHTPKNLMIAAVKTHPLGGDAGARERIERLKAEFGLGRMTLDGLLAMKAE
jgi:SAM-dependent methyltransferase